MARKTITKTVHQHSAGPVPPEVMEKLQAIAEDYCTVKNYVYQRYSGIRSLAKLYPGYTVQNEMTKSGLRKKLGLPVACFYPAIFEALVDIRTRWEREKNLIRQRICRNESFSEADRHYLLFLTSVDKFFIAVLNHQLADLEAPAKLKGRYEELSRLVEADRLENYLRRQVRKIHGKPHAEKGDRFTMTIDGYRYGDHGIYLVTKERRKRVFVRLTDSNTYARQLEIRLLPAEQSLEVKAPIEVRVRQHEDYQAEVGAAMGMKVMLTTHEGHTYGEEIGKYHQALSGWMREEQSKYQKNCQANPGRKKHEARRRRLEEQLHSYINKELNRFLRTEKPARIYIMRFPRGNKRYGDRAVSYSVSTWQRGYIRSQLRLKCSEHAVDFVEVFGKDIGIECSQCGAIGSRENDVFRCECGHTVPEKQNTAQNAKKRGMSLQNK